MVATRIERVFRIKSKRWDFDIENSHKTHLIYAQMLTKTTTTKTATTIIIIIT